MISTQALLTRIISDLLVVAFVNIAVIGGLILLTINPGFLVKDYFSLFFFLLHALIGGVKAIAHLGIV